MPKNTPGAIRRYKLRPLVLSTIASPSDETRPYVDRTANNTDIGIVTVREKGRIYKTRRRTTPTGAPLLMIRYIKRIIWSISSTKVKVPSPSAKEAAISLSSCRSIRQKGCSRLVRAVASPARHGGDGLEPSGVMIKVCPEPGRRACPELDRRTGAK